MAGSRETCPGCRVLGDAEVRQVDMVRSVHVDPGRDDDVPGLDVTVDEALPVRRVERGGDLAEDVQRRHGLEPLRLLEPRLQVDTLDVAHDDEQDAVGFSGFVDRDDVRVIDRRRKMGLAFEPLAEAGVVCELRRQDLERHVALETRLNGAVDDAHAAPTDQPLDPVAGELRADPRVGVDTHCDSHVLPCSSAGWALGERWLRALRARDSRRRDETASSSPAWARVRSPRGGRRPPVTTTVVPEPSPGQNSQEHRGASIVAGPVVSSREGA